MEVVAGGHPLEPLEGPVHHHVGIQKALETEGGFILLQIHQRA